MTGLKDYELPNGIDPERVITHPLYCAMCGYDLRFGTHVGVCSECGNPYNARPLVMKGIFLPDAIRFPFLDMLVAMLFLGGAYPFFRYGINPVVQWRLYIGALFVLLGFVHVVVSFRALSRFIHCQRVLRRIRSEQD